jgi:hypothetical protein
MGNLFAGLLAQRMGLPVKFICANNANDVGSLLFSRNLMVRGPGVRATASPAMDISAPYNAERVLWLCAGAAQTRSWMAAFERDGECAVDIKTPVQFAGKADDAQTLRAMRRAWDVHAYLLGALPRAAGCGQRLTRGHRPARGRGLGRGGGGAQAGFDVRVRKRRASRRVSGHGLAEEV